MRYWIGVAAKEHVARGVAGGFFELCHGKAQPLKRMSKDDWIIYYSSKEMFAGKTLCQQLTAIGRVLGDEVYSFEMTPEFMSFRRNIDFLPCDAVDIRPLIPQLEFIKDKNHWGYSFRFGHFEIAQNDFDLISQKMLGSTELARPRQFALV